MNTIEKYWSTNDLCNRFRCSNRTIYRKMERDKNPFPQPYHRSSGSQNLWLITDVTEWEEKEHQRSLSKAA